MQSPKITKLDIPHIIQVAKNLPATGILLFNNDFTYLDIDDQYIHQLFPLLNNKNIKKPDYFSENSCGAHITVIYEEENIIINKKELMQSYSFICKEVAKVELGLKKYYIILVESNSLLQLRRKYALPDMLCFRNHAIGFHITIGIEVLD